MDSDHVALLAEQHDLSSKQPELRRMTPAVIDLRSLRESLTPERLRRAEEYLATVVADQLEREGRDYGVLIVKPHDSVKGLLPEPVYYVRLPLRCTMPEYARKLAAALGQESLRGLFFRRDDGTFAPPGPTAMGGSSPNDPRDEARAACVVEKHERTRVLPNSTVYAHVRPQKKDSK